MKTVLVMVFAALAATQFTGCGGDKDDTAGDTAGAPVDTAAQDTGDAQDTSAQDTGADTGDGGDTADTATAG
jgi:hypothetical protein